MAQRVGRREKLAQKVGRREIYSPVPPPSINPIIYQVLSKKRTSALSKKKKGEKKMFVQFW